MAGLPTDRYPVVFRSEIRYDELLHRDDGSHACAPAYKANQEFRVRSIQPDTHGMRC